MDWAQKEWADHLQGLRQSWKDGCDNIKAEPGRAFGAQRLLISQWVDFLDRWASSDRGFDEVFQEMIDEMVPEAARAVGLDPLDLWFKVTALWNWRQARKQTYEDGYLMVEGAEDEQKHRKGAKGRR